MLISLQEKQPGEDVDKHFTCLPWLYPKITIKCQKADQCNRATNPVTCRGLVVTLNHLQITSAEAERRLILCD